MSAAAHVVDARGTRCPVPVLRAARAVKALRQAGGPATVELTVLASDPAAEADLPAWARLKGYQVIEVRRAQGDEVSVRLLVDVRPAG